MRVQTDRRNHKSQTPAEVLAHRLLERLGYCGALRACQENHWQGAKILIENKRFRNSMS